MLWRVINQGKKIESDRESDFRWNDQGRPPWRGNIQRHEWSEGADHAATREKSMPGGPTGSTKAPRRQAAQCVSRVVRCPVARGEQARGRAPKERVRAGLGSGHEEPLAIREEWRVENESSGPGNQSLRFQYFLLPLTSWMTLGFSCPFPGLSLPICLMRESEVISRDLLVLWSVGLAYEVQNYSRGGQWSPEVVTWPSVYICSRSCSMGYPSCWTFCWSLYRQSMVVEVPGISRQPNSLCL